MEIKRVDNQKISIHQTHARKIHSISMDGILKKQSGRKFEYIRFIIACPRNCLNLLYHYSLLHVGIEEILVIDGNFPISKGTQPAAA